MSTSTTSVSASHPSSTHGEIGRPQADPRHDHRGCGDGNPAFCGGVRILQRGEVLYEVGTVGHEIFVCLRGLLKSRKHDHVGREVITQVLEPGSRFGVEAVLALPYGTTVQAIEPTEVCSTRVEDLEAVVKKDPGVTLKLVRSLAEQVMRLEENLRDFGLKSARSRAASVLLARAHVGTGESEPHPAVTPDLTRQDLAALAGMTPETFIRVLSSFRSKGIVRAEGRRLTIMDPKRLASIAGQQIAEATCSVGA